MMNLQLNIPQPKSPDLRISGPSNVVLGPSKGTPPRVKLVSLCPWMSLSVQRAGLRRLGYQLRISRIWVPSAPTSARQPRHMQGFHTTSRCQDTKPHAI